MRETFHRFILLKKCKKQVNINAKKDLLSNEENKIMMMYLFSYIILFVLCIINYLNNIIFLEYEDRVLALQTNLSLIIIFNLIEVFFTDKFKIEQKLKEKMNIKKEVKYILSINLVSIVLTGAIAFVV